MVNFISDTTLQIICIILIVAFVGLAFYAVNSAVNHLNHRVDEIERVLHKHYKKHR